MPLLKSGYQHFLLSTEPNWASLSQQGWLLLTSCLYMLMWCLSSLQQTPFPMTPVCQSSGSDESRKTKSVPQTLSSSTKDKGGWLRAVITEGQRNPDECRHGYYEDLRRRARGGMGIVRVCIEWVTVRHSTLLFQYNEHLKLVSTGLFF